MAKPGRGGREWRDQPRSLGCFIVVAFGTLTALAFGAAVIAILLAIR